MIAVFIWTISDAIGVVFWGFILLCGAILFALYVIGRVLEWFASPKRIWKKKK